MSTRLTNNGLVTRIFRMLRTRLSDSGFHEADHGISCMPLGNDAIGWIGLNKAVYGNDLSIAISPVVGIRNQSLERILAKLNDSRYDPVSPPTLAANIGYISERNSFVQYSFVSDIGSCEIEADRLVSDIVAHGIPFMKKVSEIGELIAVMQSSPFLLKESVDYRIPVGQMMLGDQVGARRFIRGRLHALDGRVDAAAERYRRFAGRLDREMSDRTGEPYTPTKAG